MRKLLLFALLLTCSFVRAEDRPEGKYGYPTEPGAFRPSYVRSYTNGHTTWWVAEVLTADSLAHAIPRKGFTFKADPDVPKEFRVTPQDYAHSGDDRGHLGNFADGAKNEKSAAATFLMSNMVPQRKKLNEGHTKWEGLESWLRDQARDKGATVIVFSGPAFLPNEDGIVTFRALGTHAVWEPTHCFKTAVIEYPHHIVLKTW
ncbi:MAG: DNA/RNA non-specific endonuclease, partial [Patescibacteria group bacterium]|nr:DNA/RNA non-specific endonuclease [Patescibacteria group bacterium]